MHLLASVCCVYLHICVRMSMCIYIYRCIWKLIMMVLMLNLLTPTSLDYVYCHCALSHHAAVSLSRSLALSHHAAVWTLALRHPTPQLHPHKGYPTATTQRARNTMYTHTPPLQWPTATALCNTTQCAHVYTPSTTHAHTPTAT